MVQNTIFLPVLLFFKSPLNSFAFLSLVKRNVLVLSVLILVPLQFTM